MPDFVIEHRDFGGSTIASFENPARLRWQYQTGNVGPGKLEYDLAESDPGVERDGFSPKTVDVALTDGAGDLWGGIMWSVNYPLSGQIVSCVANDWVQWLDQPPLGLWDYDTDIAAVVAGLDPLDLVVIFAAGATVDDIFHTFVDPITDGSLTGQLELAFSLSGASFAEELTGYLERTPSATVLSLVQTIAQMGAPFGFDFWAEAGKTITAVGPRRTDPTSVSPVYSFTGPEDIIDGDFTNNGPQATEILWKDGVGNTARYWHKEHAPSIDQFRRWGKMVELDGGDTSTFQAGGLADADFKAQAAQQRLMFPQRELTLTVMPEAGFGFGNHVMEAVDIDYEKYATSYHRIDSFWWITSQTYYVADEGQAAGEWLCDLTLDQINVPISS